MNLMGFDDISWGKKNQNHKKSWEKMKIFKKHFFFAINDLMNLAGADYQILAY